jgi:anti-anti-sigma regulatory factor
MSNAPFDSDGDEPISEMTDVALYQAYNHAKQAGPQPRLDELQAEIAQRWEATIQREHEV